MRARLKPRSSQSKIRIAVVCVVSYLALVLLNVHMYSLETMESILPLGNRPRPGEAFVSDEAFVHCVGQLLTKGREAPCGDAIPLLIMPVTLDYMDMKAFFCNLTVPVERVLLVNTGIYVPLRRVLNRLTDTVNAPGQLFVRHYPENIGYSAAVNIGFRMALDLGIEKAPFAVVANADTRFIGNVFQDLVKEISVRTQGDAARIRELEAIKEVEHGLYRTYTDEKVSVWHGHYDTGLVVTSRLLPVRIRRLPKREMAKAFSNHTAFFYTHKSAHKCVFAVSYLALATVGLFDENGYPAYLEDADISFRAANLGFRQYMSDGGRDIHYSNANLMYSSFLAPDRLTTNKDAAPQLLKFTRMHSDKIRRDYKKKKWYPKSKKLTSEYRSTFPFDGLLPVDAWVKDMQRIKSIRDIGEGRRCLGDFIPYDLSLVNDVL